MCGMVWKLSRFSCSSVFLFTFGSIGISTVHCDGMSPNFSPTIYDHCCVCIFQLADIFHSLPTSTTHHPHPVVSVCSSLQSCDHCAMIGAMIQFTPPVWIFYPLLLDFIQQQHFHKFEQCTAITITKDIAVMDTFISTNTVNSSILQPQSQGVS